jgi:hypothetical protein
MAFSDSTVEACWKIAGGICEQCGKRLDWNSRGRFGEGEWEAHHIDGNLQNDSLSNCEIICWSCHETTF